MQWLDKLKGYREIAIFLTLGFYGVTMLMGLLRLFDGGEYDPGLAYNAAFAYSAFVEGLFALVLVLLVLSLATQEPRSPRVGTLALISGIVVGAGVVIALALSLVGLGIDGRTGLGTLTYLLTVLINVFVPALAAAVLFLIYLGTKPQPAYQHPQQYGQQYGGQQQSFPGQQQYGQPDHGQMPQSQPSAQQPTWQPDQASGGAWHSAGQAASGASASEWGQPGQQQGWVPQSAHSATEFGGQQPPAPGQYQQPPQQPQQNQWQPVDPQQHNNGGYGQQ